MNYTFVHVKNKQLNLLPKMSKAYGGDLLKSRQGRAHGRPLSTKDSIHLVLRSTMAKGAMSFRRPNHQKSIERLIRKFATRHDVQVQHVANVGNHLHLQIRLLHRSSYRRFIRALTSAIAMAITGVNRWNKLKTKIKFWDRRPFTRVIIGRRAYLGLKDHIQLNQLEGQGYTRREAQWIIRFQLGRFLPIRV